MAPPPQPALTAAPCTATARPPAPTTLPDHFALTGYVTLQAWRVGSTRSRPASTASTGGGGSGPQAGPASCLRSRQQLSQGDRAQLLAGQAVHNPGQGGHGAGMP